MLAVADRSALPLARFGTTPLKWRCYTCHGSECVCVHKCARVLCLHASHAQRGEDRLTSTFFLMIVIICTGVYLHPPPKKKDTIEKIYMYMWEEKKSTHGRLSLSKRTSAISSRSPQLQLPRCVAAAFEIQNTHSLAHHSNAQRRLDCARPLGAARAHVCVFAGEQSGERARVLQGCFHVVKPRQ